jgi:hypothetical protein
MFKKVILVLSFLVISLEATDYMLVVDVENLKSNGKNWDIGGGAPDIFLTIDREKLPLSAECKNEYRCVIEFYSDAQDWYIEIFDKDGIVNDIIGRGNCAVNKTCTLGQGKIKIIEKT